MVYSIPYILLVSFFILLSIIEYNHNDNKQIKYNIRIISAILFILFFGLRGFIGSDWIHYYPFYNNLSDSNQLFTENGHEWGFTLLAKLISILGLNFHTYILILSFINVILLDNFLKKYSSNISFSYAILISFQPLLCIDLLRNFISILIFLLSIQYILDRKLFKFIITIIAALLFHSSAILFFPLYFFAGSKWNKVLLICIMVIGLIIYIAQIQYLKPIIIFFGHFLGGRYLTLTELYLNSPANGGSYGLRIGIIEKIVLFILVLYKYDDIIQHRKANIIFINVLFLYIFINIYFNEVQIYIQRLSLLFSFSYWIIIPELFIVFRKRNNKMIIILLLYLLTIFKIAFSTNRIIYKYENILINKIDYDKRTKYLDEYYSKH